MEALKVKKCAEGVTQIVNGINDCMYLIEGSERAVLIDTGTGYGNLKETVESLTSLPVEVLLTHGHVDHVGGMFEFEKVRIHPDDIRILRKHSSLEMRKEYVELISPEIAASLKEEDYTQNREMAFYPVHDGDIISLGDRELEVIEVPGHTAGSVIYLDRKNRIAFMGDCCCIRTIMFLFTNSVSIKRYMESLRKILLLAEEVDEMFWGHYDGVLTKECLWNVFESATAILNDEDEKTPFSFMGETGYSAHALMPDQLNRVDGKVGNIVYNPKLVR